MKHLDTLFGTKIFVDDTFTVIPRMTLSEKVTVSETFRKEMNEWMLEFFGVKHQAIKIPEGIIVSHKIYKTLLDENKIDFKNISTLKD